ncbi:MAG: 3-oxoacyl-ACP reductase FabG [Bacteroidales bacterium]|nr:MAG: 3-oxoacyl-ACP reductase FabG [Bacteroidales bacterium]
MRYALVTGGSKGIGRDICLKLASMEYYVLVNYNRSETGAGETLEMILRNGGKGELIKFDVSNPDEVNAVLDKWIEENSDSYIEVLVNNAGIRKDAVLVWMTDDEWKDVINTNLSGFFYVTRKLIKDMMVRKYGRIVNVVSLSGIKGLPGQTNYSASKAGVIAATKALAQEVGKKNVTVNAVAPGYIVTDMTKDLDEKDFKSIIPLNRFGTPGEVAEVVGFLASESSSYINGEVISVNGGLYT